MPLTPRPFPRRLIFTRGVEGYARLVTVTIFEAASSGRS